MDEQRLKWTSRGWNRRAEIEMDDQRLKWTSRG